MLAIMLMITITFICIVIDWLKWMKCNCLIKVDSWHSCRKTAEGKWQTGKWEKTSLRSHRELELQRTRRGSRKIWEHCLFLPVIEGKFQLQHAMGWRRSCRPPSEAYKDLHIWICHRQLDDRESLSHSIKLRSNKSKKTVTTLAPKTFQLQLLLMKVKIVNQRKWL